MKYEVTAHITLTFIVDAIDTGEARQVIHDELLDVQDVLADASYRISAAGIDDVSECDPDEE